MTTTAVNNTLVQPLTCMAGGQATNQAAIMALQTLDCCPGDTGRDKMTQTVTLLDYLDVQGVW